VHAGPVRPAGGEGVRVEWRGVETQDGEHVDHPRPDAIRITERHVVRQARIDAASASSGKNVSVSRPGFR
jgi:hypothetical protein